MTMDQSSGKICTRQRKALIDKIAGLTETEHNEIYKMLKDVMLENNIGITQNRNGVFINFKLIPSDVVAKIEKFVDFCNSNRHTLDEYDKCINECKLNKDVSKVIFLHQQHFESNDVEADADGSEVLEITKASNGLQDVIARENRNHLNKNCWADIMKEAKEKKRITAYVDTLENNYNKIHKKKTCNMKYANAKKKYARKILVEKKIDTEVHSNLELEAYVVS